MTKRYIRLNIQFSFQGHTVNKICLTSCCTVLQNIFSSSLNEWFMKGVYMCVCVCVSDCTLWPFTMTIYSNRNYRLGKSEKWCDVLHLMLILQLLSSKSKIHQNYRQKSTSSVKWQQNLQNTDPPKPRPSASLNIRHWHVTYPRKLRMQFIAKL